MQHETIPQAGPKTPRAAAIAGILSSVLLLAAFILIRISVPADPKEPGAWLLKDAWTVELALGLLLFAGVAFLWFIGVLRDRLDQQEHRFFATVFFGSGLLFLCMLFVFAAFGSGILIAFTSAPHEMMNSTTFRFARATAYTIANVYMLKMAAVFMISTSTVSLVTAIAPRWIAYAGFACGLLLLFAGSYLDWIFAVFPLWVLLISAYILFDNFRQT